MRIARIGHATTVVSVDELHCIMDPVLRVPFCSDLLCFDPPVEIDLERISERCRIAIISHEHADHFDVKSLELIRRDAEFLYPAGAKLIETVLRRMGFRRSRPVSPGQDEVRLGPLRLVPTPSDVPFPEMGMFFFADGASCWNQVDSHTSEPVLAWVKAALGRPDLLLAKYQPIVEWDISVDALGGAFPHPDYGAHLAGALDIAPRWLAPGACGFRYVDSWLNDRGFPITPAQFLSDLAAHSEPDQIRGLLLQHGEAVELRRPKGGELDLQRCHNPWAQQLGQVQGPSYHWQPQNGVPPLRDQNRLGYSETQLRERLQAFLNQKFLLLLASPGHQIWRERMARLGVLWRLQIVHPDGAIDTRCLDLRQTPLRWLPDDPAHFAKIQTAVTASTLLGVLEGEVLPERLVMGELRMAFRLYESHRGGAVRAGSTRDEPLLRVVLPGARELFIERELNRLGY